MLISDADPFVFGGIELVIAERPRALTFQHLSGNRRIERLRGKSGCYSCPNDSWARTLKYGLMRPHITLSKGRLAVQYVRRALLVFVTFLNINPLLPDCHRDGYHNRAIFQHLK